MEYEAQKISGRLLRAARILTGVGQKALVHEIDVSRSTLKLLERHGVQTMPQTTRPSAVKLLEFFDKRGVKFTKFGENYCGVYLAHHEQTIVPTTMANQDSNG